MAEFKNTVNAVSIMGAIKESKLKMGEGTDTNTNAKYNYINGSVIIKCGETREINLKVYTKELTKAGKVNKKYANLAQLVPDKEGNTELPTMAKVSEEEATKVSVWGSDNFTPQLKDNFYADNGAIHESVDIDLGLGNFTLKEPHQVTPDQYKAEFEVSTFVYSVEEEIKNEVGTGRAKIKTFVPAYNGTVLPLTILAGIVEDEEGEYDFGQDLLNGLQSGDTVVFWGDICFDKTVVETKRGGEGGRSFGRAKIDTKTTTVKEFVVVGATVVEDYEKAFELEDIQEAVKQRKIALDNKLKESEQPKETPKTKGLQGGKPNPMGGATRTTGKPLF